MSSKVLRQVNKDKVVHGNESITDSRIFSVYLPSPTMHISTKVKASFLLVHAPTLFDSEAGNIVCLYVRKQFVDWS